MALYHFGWRDEQGRPSAFAGRARSLLCPLLSATVDGGSWERARDAAAAWYVMSGSFLIHDDVVDADRVRRGRLALWAQYGAPEAILTGDALLSAAFEILAEHSTHATVDAVRMLAGTACEVACGQILDVAAERRVEISSATALNTTVAKTCSYLRCGAYLGALYAQTNPDQVGAMADFGHHLGMIVQLSDDLADIWGDPDEAGIPARTDIVARKKTLPVVAALSSQRPERSELAQYYETTHTPDQDELQHLADLLDRCGGRAWCQQRMQDEVTAAHDCLDRAAAHPQARQNLADYALLLTHSSLASSAPANQS
ncbi:polyprenyl synthetase family protein [Actinomadura rubrisoli]|nr:polyprenyl synthetase family protein [Actinomadura rubrisoli]